jgi:hypothetical protein
MAHCLVLLGTVRTIYWVPKLTIRIIILGAISILGQRYLPHVDVSQSFLRI